MQNVVDIGDFVDIGVGQDGLVHSSKLSQKYAERLQEVVAVRELVTVEVKRESSCVTMVKVKE